MPKARFIVLKIILIGMLAAIAWKLFDLQILKGEEYLEVANARLTTNITKKLRAARFLTDTEFRL